MKTFEEIHTKYISLDIIRENHRLIDLSEEIKLGRGDEFIPSSKFIYMITSGYMSMYLYETEQLVGLTIEFMPIGLVEAITPPAKFRYICETPVVMLKLSRKDFFNAFFITHKETEELITVLTNMFSFTIHSNINNTNETAYESIVSMLHRYMYRKDHVVDFKEGIASFIVKRTKISKSYVFEVLSSLKEGGYITVSKGKLLSINKKLPSGY
jgi:CRP-like cAMP-binding protein